MDEDPLYPNSDVSHAVSKAFGKMMDLGGGRMFLAHDQEGSAVLVDGMWVVRLMSDVAESLSTESFVDSPEAMSLQSFASCLMFYMADAVGVPRQHLLDGLLEEGRRQAGGIEALERLANGEAGV